MSHELSPRASHRFTAGVKAAAEAELGERIGVGTTIAAFSSVRPWSIDPAFDDIAVITHPEHRHKGRAAAVVSALSSQQQAAGRLLLYNCDVDNIGSNHVAESVSFDLVATVTAVSIG